MVDVVFSSSACGSLKQAQHFGQGNYRGGVAGVVLNGETITEEEREAALRRAEEAHRRAWERAQPMGGNPGDVCGFGLGLSVGDISEDVPGLIRQKILCELVHFPLALPGISEQIDHTMEEARKNLPKILQRSSEGETVRLWYSGQPDELCGFLWLTAQLDRLGDRCGPIRTVRLPSYGQRDDGTVVTWNGWGEVSPGEWSTFLPLEQPMPPVLRRAAAARWRALQEENAPLRALVNGQPVSVPAGFYDSFIRQALAEASAEFHEAKLIGDIMGRFQLGIGDGWIANRIETMVSSGELEVVTPAPEDGPTYRRVLRKRPAL